MPKNLYVNKDQRGYPALSGDLNFTPSSFYQVPYLTLLLPPSIRYPTLLYSFLLLLGTLPYFTPSSFYQVPYLTLLLPPTIRYPTLLYSFLLLLGTLPYFTHLSSTSLASPSLHSPHFIFSLSLFSTPSHKKTLTSKPSPLIPSGPLFTTPPHTPHTHQSHWDLEVLSSQAKNR